MTPRGLASKPRIPGAMPEPALDVILPSLMSSVIASPPPSPSLQQAASARPASMEETPGPLRSPAQPARENRALRARRGLLSRVPWMLALLLTFAPVYAAGAEIVHVVGKGQTLGRIAKRYRVSVDALREANGLHAGERIHPGLSLVIPEKDGKPGGKKAAEPPGATASAKKGGKRGGKPGEIDEKTFRGPRRRGFVRLARGQSEKLEVQLTTRHGHLAPAALAGLSQILRFSPNGAKTPIDPRLAALVGQVSDHFGGRRLLVVSGFRPYSPVQYTSHSNHNVGRAMDFSVEGVSNTMVRDFCRTFRNAGVGYYPNSTFVHLDVRTGKAYWVDYSHPGEAPHYDSPGGQGNADEAVGDVEPHLGAGEGAAAPGSDQDVDSGRAPEPGSSETR